MPLVASSGAMSARVFGLSSATGSYWIATLGSGTTTSSFLGVEVGNSGSSTGDVFVSGRTSVISTGEEDGILARYDTLGAIKWQQNLGSAQNTVLGGLATDNSANFYTTGTQNTGTTPNKVTLFKYTGGPAAFFQRALTSSNACSGDAIAVDNSGNIFIVGTENSITFIAKYDSSGTYQWDYTFNNTGGTDNGYGVAVDNLGGVYVVGRGVTSCMIGKFDASTGALSWQRSLSTGFGVQFWAVATDSSGNAYALGGTGLASPTSVLVLAKYSTSGALTWQKVLSAATGYGLAVDALGDIYITGQVVSAVFIAKYDASGALQWQRTLASSAGGTGRSVAVDNAGSVYVSGSTYIPSYSYLHAFVFKLPADGSLTGTYGPFVYAVSTIAATTDLTPATVTVTSVDAGLTTTTSTLALSTSSLITSLTTI